MKNDIKYAYELFKYSLNTQRFILIFIFSIINGGLGAIYGMGISYFESLIFSFNSAFYIMFFLFIIFINTKNTIDIFQKNYFYIIRFKSKKEYIKKLIITVLVSNFLVIIINFMTLIAWRNLFGYTGALYPIKDYNISPNIYLIFCIIKFILLASIISILNTYLLLTFKYKYILIGNCILYIWPIVSSTWLYGIDSILEMPLSINYYLFSYYVAYSSFLFEVLCFIIYFLVWTLLLQLISKISFKFMRDI